MMHRSPQRRYIQSPSDSLLREKGVIMPSRVSNETRERVKLENDTHNNKLLTARKKGALKIRAEIESHIKVSDFEITAI
jgi:hypothetical protein